MKKRTVALLCAAVMLLGVIFGGSMALLSHGSAPLTNTFKAGDINLTLRETKGTLNEATGKREYIMAPGTRLDKDPTVTVTAESEKCIVFIQAEETNFGSYDPISWSVRNGWTAVPDVKNVWYRVHEKNAKEVNYYILTDERENGTGQVSVPGTLTKTQLKTYEEKKPVLSFTAYAIQYDWLPGYDAATGEIPGLNKNVEEIWTAVKEGGFALEET